MHPYRRCKRSLLPHSQLYPYGYIREDGGKFWIIDEEAAAVVRHIYDLAFYGLGAEQIACRLEEEKILSPLNYWSSKGIARPGQRSAIENPYGWNCSTIAKILTRQEYCGDVINFKTYSKSYKNKKRIENDRENWAVFKDVHAPIIERGAWEKMQLKRSRTRNKTNSIRTDFLEKVVLGEVKRLMKFATLYEDEFSQLVMGSSIKAAEQEHKDKQREINTLRQRDRELDVLFEKLYEDNVSGKISDERFGKMSLKYETEQKELRERLNILQNELDKSKSKSVTNDMFLTSVRKYTRMKKLTPRILNELIDKIEVYQAEIIDGKRFTHDKA